MYKDVAEVIDTYTKGTGSKEMSDQCHSSDC